MKEYSLISIIAHRGYSSRFRENSPTAWREAVAAGADVVEVDIRFTADGVCVCVHDPDLRRLTGRSVTVAEADYSDLADLAVDGELVAPKLRNALLSVPGGTKLLLDIKDESAGSLMRLHQLLGTTASRDIILGLHRMDSVRTMAQLGYRDILALTLNPDDAEAFVDAGASVVRVWEAHVTNERLKPLLARPVPIWSTVGDKGMRTGTGAPRLVGDFDADNLRRIAALGVSGFLVNDPAGARRALENLSVPKHAPR